jgi:TRAP-type C4-dicarboxylate transport system substrate-binding protein
MKRTLGVAVVVFVFGLIGLNCLPVHAQEKAITLNFANFFPPKHRVSLLMDQWCTEVNKRTNGRVKVTHFTGGILCPAPQTYASVIGGVADIGVLFLTQQDGSLSLSSLSSRSVVKTDIGGPSWPMPCTRSSSPRNLMR